MTVLGPISTEGAAWRRTLRQPLYRNGLALVANAGLSSLLGVVYWAVVTHLVTPRVVGVNTALVVGMIALSNVGQLSLGSAVVSYLPRTAAGRARLIGRCYAIAVAASVLLGVSFVVVAPHLVRDLRVLRTPWIAATFVVAVAVWSVFGLQDNVLTALRRALCVPLENVGYSAAKLGLLFAIGGSVAGVGVFVSWFTPAVLCLLPVNLLIFRRLLPQTSSAAGDRPAAMPFRRFVTGETSGVLLWQVGTTMLPLLVVARVGAAAGARFAIPWLLAQSVDLVAVNLGMSLTVEGAHDHTRAQELLAGLVRRALPAIAGVAAVGILIAPLVLRIYGHGYGSASTAVLRLLLLACAPRAVVVLSICAARAELALARILILQTSLSITVPIVAWALMGPLGVQGAAVGWLVGHLVAMAIAVRCGWAGLGGRTRPSAGRRPRILCTGFWHDDNGGDAAIAEATIRLLRERWPDAEIAVMSLLRSSDGELRHSARHLTAAAPDVRLLPALLADEINGGGASRLGVVRAVRWLARLAGPMLRVLVNRPPAISAISDADLVIALGGCDVYDNGAVSTLFSQARLLTVLYPSWITGRVGVPLALFGHTLGPFPRRRGRALAERMVGHAAWVSTRERQSVAVAEAIGLHHAVVGTDAAFSLAPRPTDRTRNVVGRFGARTVGLVVRQHPHGTGADDDRLVAEFARLGRALLERGDADHLAVVVQARGPTAVEDDRLISGRLARLLPPDRVTLVDEDLPPGELAAVYGALRLVVTVRLHAAILAMTAGTPAFAVSYFSTKTQGIMEGVGGSDAWCDHESFRASMVLDRFEDLVAPARVASLGRRVGEHAADLRAEVARWELAMTTRASMSDS